MQSNRANRKRKSLKYPATVRGVRDLGASDRSELAACPPCCRTPLSDKSLSAEDDEPCPGTSGESAPERFSSEELQGSCGNSAYRPVNACRESIARKCIVFEILCGPDCGNAQKYDDLKEKELKTMVAPQASSTWAMSA